MVSSVEEHKHDDCKVSRVFPNGITVERPVFLEDLCLAKRSEADNSLNELSAFLVTLPENVSSPLKMDAEQISSFKKLFNIEKRKNLSSLKFEDLQVRFYFQSDFVLFKNGVIVNDFKSQQTSLPNYVTVAAMEGQLDKKDTNEKIDLEEIDEEEVEIKSDFSGKVAQLFALIDPKVIVEKELGESFIKVSKGKWNMDDLKSYVNYSLRVKENHIGDSVFLNRVPASIFAQTIFTKNSFAFKEILIEERSFNIIRNAANSFLKEERLLGVSPLNPSLVSVANLSMEEKAQFLRAYFGIDSITPEIETEFKSFDYTVAPLIVFWSEFKQGDEKRKIGVSSIVSFPWLLQRTLRSVGETK